MRKAVSIRISETGTDYIPNLMRMITMELVGVYDGVADSVQFDFLPAFQTVIL